ncbi:MAG: hypothetical protein IKC94_06190 [Lentisphaeria bacterium]|nr:hypothetical protein [Lentisphaeria bacterium]
MTHKHFTLIEIVVVLVIIMLVTGIAVSAFRGESPSQLMDRTAIEIESYLAKVRFLCAESGRDYVVHYLPEEKVLCAHVAFSDEELENMKSGQDDVPGAVRYTLAEDVELFIIGKSEEFDSDDEQPELFRFYPTGGGVCVNRPGIRINELAKNFEISYLSGQLIVHDGDGSREEERN